MMYSKSRLYNAGRTCGKRIVIQYYYYFCFIIISGVRLSPVGTGATTGLLYQMVVIMEQFVELDMGRGNRTTRRKTAPAPLYAPQIPHDQTRARNLAAAVGSQRLTA
jgi:hypothetical protein